MALIGAVANSLQAGGSALSLIGSAKALLSSKQLPPGIAKVGAQSSFLGDLQAQFLYGNAPSFLFDIPKSQNLALRAQITDHFVEKNYAVQDHMAIEPVRITLTGDMAELVCRKTDIEKFLDEVLTRLKPLKALGPIYGRNEVSAQKYLSDANRLKSAIDTSVKNVQNIVGQFDGKPAKNAQQKAYDTLEGMMLTKAVVSVETPWKTFPSMLIESLDFDQDESTDGVTTVTVVVKELKTTQTTTGVGLLKERIAAQASDVVDKGSVLGESVGVAILDNVKTFFSDLGDWIHHLDIGVK